MELNHFIYDIQKEGTYHDKQFFNIHTREWPSAEDIP